MARSAALKLPALFFLLVVQAGPLAAQECPAPLASARRLVLVVAETMNTKAATLQLFERVSPGERWRALGAPEPAVVGRAGLAWSRFFRRLAGPGEPIKVEGDKRAPAGVYSLGRTFGTLTSSRAGHLHVVDGTVCVDDPASPAYNTITSRAAIGPQVHAENMSRMLPMYRRGIVVDYPTDARARAGSCIFVHVWKTPTTGTAGCVALPEARVDALMDFAAPGAVIAILPKTALGRLRGCLPPLAAGAT